MVSKEPNHLLTGQSNGKSTLADKLPGTMTVRSVLLNRDSPDIESRLKRRRNRTHQVRFKDLEDGSSSSGNSATGENNTRQRPAKDRDSPHPLRKHNSMSSQPWTDRPHTESLLGQTSVVGAVRGDMASTIEKVAAFLARAPPHPLTPGPTRRCWVPPQSNSLTLPMTRRPSTSTSTAIQTSPCLKKPQSLSSTQARSHSIGDSVGVDGDDEHDSQDEYLSHNHVLLGSKDQSRPPSCGDKTVVERRSKVSKTEIKSGVMVKQSRHSCPPSVLHNNDLCHSTSISCRDGPKRQGSSTPSVVRRRKRLSRTTSDPGKEVHFCTTPTQTESPPRSPPPTNTKLCTTEVQTEGPSSSPASKHCTTQSQTERKHQSLNVSDEHCSTQIQTTNSCPTLPQNVEQCTPQKQANSPCPSSPNHKPCTTQLPTCSSVASPPLIASPILDSDIQVSASAAENPPTTNISTVPYCTSPPTLANAPLQITEKGHKAASSSPTKPASVTNPPPNILPILSSTPAPSASQSPIPYYTVLSPPTPPSKTAVCSSPSFSAPQSSSYNCTSPVSISSSSLTCSIPTPNVSTILTSREPNKQPNAVPNVRHQQPPSGPTNNVPLTNLTPCTIVTQTALSCTSISYYTGTHPGGSHTPQINQTTPSYTTVIQTVSHCNIPYQTVQNNPPASTGITLYPSPVPRLESCTSPPPIVKAYVSTLQNAQACGTPTKAVPLYSSTFRAAPPYTPPSQAPYNAQDKRGIRLPPPPPPPPPYTPRKKGSEPVVATVRTSMLRTESKANEKGMEREEKKEDTMNMKCTDSPKFCGRASSLKHRTQTPPVAVMKGERRSSTSSPAKACFKPSCLSSAQAQLGVLHKMLCSGASVRPNTPNSQHSLPSNQQGCSGARGCSASGGQPATGTLSPTKADTLRQVQEILGGLMSGARCKLDPSRVTEKLLSPNGPLHDIRSLQNQLHSLEGVLETSQNTIKVLLDVIQDLEKKEAERDGRHSYRTGQDIENCGTCRDCACIIYSVEHDFRLQEGQVVRTWKVGDPPEGSPQTPTSQTTTPQQQDSPQLMRPPASTKKNRKKCFWFL
ncbi:uncharacterized protein LOC129374222 isoform X1 [Poeciliopsis prolifica]|uniref:uncharacterized protein LOC129374222 isoform X1 n=1 Tax=Poeciliopsis prolifica TaxID=188132 RepID=UPI00241377E6|nr:uncharacterized protein LOC129374222 isoform X1 [Poeciliopsis prolifica]XP_054908487.1 uncharacterized protein LOC129374222 isoform X1 [Poeciliopsis prolifica]XP_054908488.1 uncharacterized protein LOC129374222 isoform X1 [Poeciliopsis prolifica]XP_054908490.1 uncharacterized protein LOC129374222 isoform X1 [Poeciliopsis prolifica]XP_054908491.1 uncharacterized protein LOC129374222 isoform X1 [Poeciliopsis prolifica]XP_054908492.1 uncharacterized protein LOC129374222 isoform X1 [Poeciliopsi